MTLYDLMAMDSAVLHRVLQAGHPLDPAVLAGRQYLGVDLSLPGWARKLLWHTFRKTFVSVWPGTAGDVDVRGWNVRMEQHGVDGARVPQRDRHGKPITFGHYRVRRSGELRFPRWSGTHYLDYGSAGNPFHDPARFGRTPLVAVNEGRQDLLLGPNRDLGSAGRSFASGPRSCRCRSTGRCAMKGRSKTSLRHPADAKLLPRTPIRRRGRLTLTHRHCGRVARSQRPKPLLQADGRASRTREAAPYSQTSGWPSPGG